MKKEDGYTLVEVLIVVFISVLMLMAIYTAVNTGQTSSGNIERRVAAQQDVRGALELMSMEIQMASYNPTESSSIWVSPSDCNASSSNMTYRGIQQAGANYITVEMDTNGTGVITSNTTNNPNEVIKYVYDATNLYIYRNSDCGSANVPFLGAPASSTGSQTVLVQNATAGSSGASIPVFTYYDGNNNQLYPNSTGDIGANIPYIRKIVITLVVDTYSTDKNGTRRRIVYSTGVIPRNHSLPLF